MRISKRGAAFLRAHEGFVARYYLDPVGVGTIGVGFTWASASFREWWAKNRPGQKFGPGASMTAAEADSCLVYLCDAEYGAAVNRFLAGKVVEQHVFDAMCSMIFNCGPKALEWRWAALMKAGNMTAAVKAWKDTATTAKGKKLPGLVRRRKEEAELAQFGRYAGVSVVSHDPPVRDSQPDLPVAGGSQPATIEQGPVPSGNWLAGLLKALLEIVKGWKK